MKHSEVTISYLNIFWIYIISITNYTVK